MRGGSRTGSEGAPGEKGVTTLGELARIEFGLDLELETPIRRRAPSHLHAQGAIADQLPGSPDSNPS